MKKELSVNIDMLLTELNNTSLTNEERAEILTTIVDLESEKPDGDMDLIRECLDYLAFLNNAEGEAEARTEQLPERLQRIYQKAGDGEGAAKEKKQPVGRKRRFRKAGIAVAIIVAILLVAVTSLTVIARVQGYDDVWDWISSHWKELMKEGEISRDDVTVTWTPRQTYPDIESWHEETGLDILYPSVLPDGVHLLQVNQYDRGEGKLGISLVYDSVDIVIEAQNHDLFRLDRFTSWEFIEVNGYHAAIDYQPEHAPLVCQAYLTVDDFSYIVGAPDRETLLFLLENLKKSSS